MGRGGYVGLSTAMTVKTAGGGGTRHGVRLSNGATTTIAISTMTQFTGFAGLTVEEDTDSYLDVANNQLVIPTGLGGVYCGLCVVNAINNPTGPSVAGTGQLILQWLTSTPFWDEQYELDLALQGVAAGNVQIGSIQPIPLGPRALTAASTLRLQGEIIQTAAPATFSIQVLSLYRVSD